MRALVISNLHAPDCTGGYEMVASECMDALERNHAWQITCHCATTGREPIKKTEIPGHPASSNPKSKIQNPKFPYPPRVHADLTGYFPRGWTHHHALLPAARHLKNRTTQIIDTLTRESAAADVTLLFNPRRLSTLQWLPAMAAARNPIAFVSDHWPAEYPDCDKLWQASQTQRISYSPAVMLGAAKVRGYYKNHPPAPADLACIKRAAFVSDYIMRKTAPAFPRLEEATVIPNGIDPALFPFAPMTSDRWRTWGFSGRIQPEKGVAQALDLFAQAAQTRPDLRFLLAGDLNATAHGAEIRRKIAATPLLARRVTLLGQIPRERLASDFYHKTGVLLFTSQWEEPFALTIPEAMSCGTYVVATPTGGTPEIVTPETGLLLPSLLPSETFTLTSHLDLRPQITRIATARQVASQFTITQMATRLAEFAFKPKS